MAQDDKEKNALINALTGAMGAASGRGVPAYNMNMANGMLEGPDTDTVVKIVNGQLLQGVLDDKIYKGKSKGLIHKIIGAIKIRARLVEIGL